MYAQRVADEVLTAREGPVLTITFNRPEAYNAFTRGIHAALHEAGYVDASFEYPTYRSLWRALAAGNGSS